MRLATVLLLLMLIGCQPPGSNNELEKKELLTCREQLAEKDKEIERLRWRLDQEVSWRLRQQEPIRQEVQKLVPIGR